MAKRLLQVANAEGLQVNEVYSLLNAVALTFLVRCLYMLLRLRLHVSFLLDYISFGNDIIPFLFLGFFFFFLNALILISNEL